MNSFRTFESERLKTVDFTQIQIKSGSKPPLTVKLSKFLIENEIPKSKKSKIALHNVAKTIYSLANEHFSLSKNYRYNVD